MTSMFSEGMFADGFFSDGMFGSSTPSTPSGTTTLRKNLRVIYNNAADTATITTSTETAGYPPSNLKKDTKGLVWRSASPGSTDIRLVWTSPQNISAVVLAFTNLPVGTNMSLRLFSDIAFASEVYSSFSDTCVLSTLPNYVSSGNDNYRYSYGGGTTARIYLSQVITNVRSAIITIDLSAIDIILYGFDEVSIGGELVSLGDVEDGAVYISTADTDISNNITFGGDSVIWDAGVVTFGPSLGIDTGTYDIVDSYNDYIEVSRVIIGNYWSPVYNTEYGVGVGTIDTSTNKRTEAGNLVTDPGTISKTLTFSLNYMTDIDRDALFSIVRNNGTKRSMYVSVFPEDPDSNKEQIFQIYGRLDNVAAITHPMYSMYASSISLQEV